MSFDADERAVSEVLGAIMVFGIIIAALGIYQAFIVPVDNQQAEFSHNQELHEDLLDLRSDIQTVQRSGTSQSKSIRLAAEYTNRIIAINPPSPIGTLRTVESSNVTLENFRGIQRDERDYWDGSPEGFESKFLLFEPSYNLFNNAPASFLDHSVLYHQFGNGANLSATDQQIIQGNLITIGTLAGDRVFNDREANIELIPISTGLTTVPVRSPVGEEAVIKIPTRLDQETWDDLLEDQMVPNGHVKDVDVSNNILTITLEGDQVYRLQMARVGIGPNVERTEAHYIVRAGGDEKAVEKDQEVDLTAQVRDRYNNPVSGHEVEFEVIDGNISFVDGNITTSNSNGHATVTVKPIKSNQTVQIRAKLTDNPDFHEETFFNLVVGDPKPSRFAEQLNPASGLIFVNATARFSGGGLQGASSMDVTFNNTLPSSIEVDEIRVNVYVPQDPGSSTQGGFPRRLDITDNQGGTDHFIILDEFAELDDLNMTFDSEQEKTFTFEFFEDEEGEEVFSIEQGDYVIISVALSTGDTSTYVIAPQPEES